MCTTVLYCADVIHFYLEVTLYTCVLHILPAIHTQLGRWKADFDEFSLCWQLQFTENWVSILSYLWRRNCFIIIYQLIKVLSFWNHYQKAHQKFYFSFWQWKVKIALPPRGDGYTRKSSNKIEIEKKYSVNIWKQ